MLHEPAATLTIWKKNLFLSRTTEAIVCELSNTKMFHLVKLIKTTREEEIMMKIKRTSNQTSTAHYFTKQ